MIISMSTTEAGAEHHAAWTALIARRARRDAPFFLVALSIFILDQLTKAIIRDWLAVGESWPDDDWLVKLTHVTNSGAAFGILQGQGLFLTVTAVIAIRMASTSSISSSVKPPARDVASRLLRTTIRESGGVIG